MVPAAKRKLKIHGLRVGLKKRRPIEVRTNWRPAHLAKLRGLSPTKRTPEEIERSDNLVDRTLPDRTTVSQRV
jgi:hypothetical protein